VTAKRSESAPSSEAQPHDAPPPPRPAAHLTKKLASSASSAALGSPPASASAPPPSEAAGAASPPASTSAPPPSEAAGAASPPASTSAPPPSEAAGAASPPAPAAWPLAPGACPAPLEPLAVAPLVLGPASKSAGRRARMLSQVRDVAPRSKAQRRGAARRWQLPSSCTCDGVLGTKQAAKEQVLGPDDAVDRLVGRVAQRADGVGLGWLAGLALEALAAPLEVDIDLRLTNRPARPLAWRACLR
jgi:hypothetical protein